MATHSRGAPYPLATDANNTAADLQALALWANERPGVTPVTTTQRNAMTGVELWDGRVVLNTTLDKFQRYDAGLVTWVSIADESQIAALLATTGTPATDATTGSRGVAAFAARSDHVHPAPPWQTWTPTMTPEFGTFTNVTSLFARYTAHGKTINYTVRVDMANIGTGTGGLRISLPFTVQGVGTPEFIAVGRDITIGPMLQGVMTAGSTVVNVLRYDNASPMASGRSIIITGMYEAA